jgi:hypothetical protein
MLETEPGCLKKSSSPSLQRAFSSERGEAVNIQVQCCELKNVGESKEELIKLGVLQLQGTVWYNSCLQLLNYIVRRTENTHVAQKSGLLGCSCMLVSKLL